MFLLLGAIEIRGTAKVILIGGWYSVPSTWRGLKAMAYVGVDDIVFTCRGESVTRTRQPGHGPHCLPGVGLGGALSRRALFPAAASQRGTVTAQGV